MRRKETNKGHCLVFQGRFDISFLRLVFKSFDVHLSLICKERPEQKANGAKQGEFINDVSKYRKSLVLFSKKNDIGWVTMWLSFLSGVNRRVSCMLSHYLTKTVYLFVNTFNLHGLFSVESHNTNTTVNVKGCVVHGPEQVLDTTHLMKGFVKDSSNSLDSNRERVAFTIFLVDNIYIYIYKTWEK